MIIVTLESLPGYKVVEVKGVVQGNCVFSKNMFKDMGAGFKSMVGGEVKAYTDMMTQSRQLATNRMIDRATELGANAILNVRYFSSSVMQGAAECMASGTAVVVEKV